MFFVFKDFSVGFMTFTGPTSLCASLVLILNRGSSAGISSFMSDLAVLYLKVDPSGLHLVADVRMTGTRFRSQITFLTV